MLRFTVEPWSLAWAYDLMSPPPLLCQTRASNLSSQVEKHFYQKNGGKHAVREPITAQGVHSLVVSAHSILRPALRADLELLLRVVTRPRLPDARRWPLAFAAHPPAGSGSKERLRHRETGAWVSSQ